MTTIPHHEGFFWAKWRIADEGTVEGDILTPCDDWQVVNVYENGPSPKHPEWLRVMVPGVQSSQSVENFFWGSEVCR